MFGQQALYMNFILHDKPNFAKIIKVTTRIFRFISAFHTYNELFIMKSRMTQSLNDYDKRRILKKN